MKEKLVDRIKTIIDHYELSLNAFDASIGKGNGYIGKQIKRRASIGSDTVETILLTYKEISPSWLITGEGEMKREKNDLNVLNEKPAEYQNDHFTNLLLEYFKKPKIKTAIKSILDEKE